MKPLFYMQSADQMLSLLNDLVSNRSITLSEEEKLFPLRVEQHLLNVPYFQSNKSHITNHVTTDGRRILTALYKHPEATKTVIMISHFDVVDVEDYGDLKHLAFRPLELTRELHNRKETLPPDAKNDIKTGDWLFGRGTMDMKCGLVQHMSLLEKASLEDWKINLLLLTVPDEEVNSVGMREAIPHLLKIAKNHQLSYTLFLNSEPMFTQTVGDEGYYFYTGSIGKILPSVLCFGKETHVGEPLSGINASWMSAVFSQEMEWNEKLCETVHGKTSPPPTVLWQRDLKKEYSAQIPHRSVSMYNMFLKKKNPADVMNLFKEIAHDATNKMDDFIQNKYKAFQLPTIHAPRKIKVLSYTELKQLACERTSTAYIASIEHSIAKERKGDNRAQAIEIVDQLAIICQDLAPMVILFFAPPYYPAVYTGDRPNIQKLSKSIIEYTQHSFGYELQEIEYFNGISDLSYALLQDSLVNMEQFNNNLPGDNELYYIPFEDIAKLQADIINVGPIGKDAHKKTERLYLPFAFKELPCILEHLIKTHEKQDV